MNSEPIKVIILTDVELYSIKQFIYKPVHYIINKLQPGEERNTFMKEKSEMEILYEQYLENENLTYEKDGILFYKLVKKEKVKLKGGMVLITVPNKAVRYIKDSYCDENGNKILIDSPVHYSFGANDIPKWYIETVTLPVKEISDISEIGDYLGRDCVVE